MRTLAYGSWPSPIDVALAAAHDGHPEYVGFVGDEAGWTEARPTEGGRRSLVRRRADGREESVLPAPWNVRSRVIEYGGQPWAGAMADGQPLIMFVHFANQRLYRYRPGGEPVPLTYVSPSAADRPREEEFGGPLWKLGHRWFAPLDGGYIAVLHGRGAAPRCSG